MTVPSLLWYQPGADTRSTHLGPLRIHTLFPQGSWTEGSSRADIPIFSWLFFLLLTAYFTRPSKRTYTNTIDSPLSGSYVRPPPCRQPSCPPLSFAIDPRDFSLFQSFPHVHPPPWRGRLVSKAIPSFNWYCRDDGPRSISLDNFTQDRRSARTPSFLKAHGLGVLA